ncbi:MAG: right-handed parallel beta-helix repeat-containing protein [Candidatus Hydrogenedentes bacterium]|nr:right-handed parallel beta-helix repeat-containing protein [Candidatus Hydrogenedentota bacterium]
MKPYRYFTLFVSLIAELLLCSTIASARAASDRILVVAPDGDDGASGTLEAPFATLTRARDAVRALKAQGEGGVTVYLRGGDYHLSEPVVFGEEDSGSEGAPVTYRNYEDETPVLAGGIPVTAWQPFRGGILQAALPEISATDPMAFQVIEAGIAGTMARTPNDGWLRLRDPEVAPSWSFGYEHGDFDPAGVDTTQLHLHLMQMGTYFSEHIPVTRVDAAVGRFYTEFKMKDPAYDPVAGKSYQIENALALLDAPGEYYADRAAGVLYYWPLTGAPVVADTVPRLFQVGGTDAARPVHDLVFAGLTFQGGNDQIAISNAARVTLRDCRLFNAGTNGISVGGGTTHFTVTGCEIARSGTNGIWIRGEYERREGGPAIVQTHGLTIHNNYIHHMGRRTITGCGISVFWSLNDSVISNNLITDGPKSGILFFSMWDMPRELGIMNNNVIRNNELARCMSSSWDGGAFYIGATTDNNTFENNRIVDAWSWFNATWPQPEDRPEDACSIDFDPGMTYNTHLRNNVAYGANATVVEFGRYEDETFLENNFFESPGRPDEILVNGKWEKHGVFDRSKVRDDIGLTADYRYPYPQEVARPVTLPVRCGFDRTLSPFYLYRYEDGFRHGYLIDSGAHEGVGAVRVDKDVMVLRYRHPTAISRKVTVWFYDDAEKAGATCLAKLRGPAAIEEGEIALGVDGGVSRDHYVVQLWEDRVVATSVARGTGWHELVFDVKEGKEHGAEILLDGTQVGRVPMFQSFTTVDLGDGRFGSDSVGLGFDTLRIE